MYQNAVPFLFFPLCIHFCKSDNILYISAVASPSHHIWNNVLAQALVERRHNVTMIGPEENIQNAYNFTYIELKGVYDALHHHFDLNKMSSASALTSIKLFDDYFIEHCRFHLEAEGLDVLVDYPKQFKFDLIITDMTMGPCLLPLIYRFNYPPTVGVTAFLLPPYLSFSFGNELSPAYQPNYHLLYDSNMNFVERLWNFLFTYLDLTLKNKRQFIYAQQFVNNKLFGGDVPSLEQLQRHVSILLANVDPLSNIALPVPPNIITVGGLHTKMPEKLPPELQKLMDDSKNGIILFSLGTNIRSDQLDTNIQLALLEAFKDRPETFIWKVESDVKNLPANVIVRKWLPQNDILGHPNTKLFIGHGGALSTQEAIFHGVPMIMIPFFLDQLMSTKLLVQKKICLKLDIHLITKEYVLNNLNEILNNPVYDNNMKRLSKAFKSRSETPLEKGLFWIEYIMRNQGADFLSPPSRDMKLHEWMNLDILLVIVIFLFTITYVLFKVVQKLIYKLIYKKKVKVL